MEILESTKLSVELLEAGKEKATKQPMSNVIDNPDSEKVIAFGHILAVLAPEDTTLDSIVKTEATRIYA